MKLKNVIYIKDLSNPKVVSDFVNDYLNLKKSKIKEYIVDFQKCDAIYPNSIVPIMAYIEALKADGENFTIWPPQDPKTAGMISVRDIKDLDFVDSPLSKIWKFDSNHIHIFVNKLMDCISRSTLCSEGVLGTIEWSVNEVMDNVPEHADVEYGYVMAQLHKASNRIALAIVDTGIGFKGSFRKSNQYRPQTDADAITLALKKGVTSSDEKGRGNGLYGLYNLVTSTEKGRLRICSASGMVNIEKNKNQKPLNSLHPLKTHGDHTITTIDFQLPLDEEINITDALEGYTPPLITARIEQYEKDNGYVFLLKDETNGFATRSEGERIRTKIENLSIELGGEKIILDFSDIAMISSSFADEVVGKLMEKYGYEDFNKSFIISNVERNVESLLNYAITNRTMNEDTYNTGDKGVKAFMKKILLYLLEKLN